MILKIIGFLFSLVLLPYVYGQNERYLTFELGGSGGLGSFNFEKEIYQKEKIKLFFRTGFSYSPIDKNNGAALIFPQMVHGVYGKQNHYADLGLGLAPSITSKLGGAYLRMPLSFGYRLQPQNKNYYWRIAYTPLMSFLLDAQWQHWAGVTFAYKFKSKKEGK